MRLTLKTQLDAAPDTVWAHLLTPRLLLHVAAPLVAFSPVRPAQLPPVWADGDYAVRMRLWGWLPLGAQTLRISRRAGREVRQLRDAGSGGLAKTWEHVIEVEPGPGGTTRYTDTLQVRAGILTPLVWAFAHLFYRHRQRRLRALARGGFAYGPAAAGA